MGGFDYPNQFTYDVEGIGFGVVSLFLTIYLSMLLLVLAFYVVLYVFQSIGMHTIAKRRGIHNAWLAWIPFGNLWVLGSISDQYQYVTKGKIKNKRKVLLSLNIAAVGVYILLLFGMAASGLLENDLGAAALMMLIEIFILLAFFALAVWLAVVQYMALYDLYRSCDPENSVLFLVFSILFSVTMPFFVFACRKKDLGMPPRKQPAQPVVIPTVETVVDPNVVEKVVIPTVETVVDPNVVEKVVIPTVETVVDPNVVEKVVIPTVEPIVESTTEPVAEGFAQPEEFEEE